MPIFLRATLTGHGDGITRFCWSPCGNYICSPSLDGTLRIWEAQMGTQRGLPVSLPHPKDPGASRSIWKVAWVERAQCRGFPPLIAVASESPIIYLYTAARIEDIDRAFDLNGHAGPVYSLAWSRDGKYLASGGFDCVIRIWGFARHPHDLEKERWSIHKTLPQPPDPGHTQGVNTLAWNPFGSGSCYLASGSRDGSIRLWDVDANRPVHCRLRDHGACVNSLTWSSDGRRLASSADDGRIFVHSWESRQTEHIIEGHTRSVMRVDFSNDGQLLASKSADGTVRIWETRSWTEVMRIPEEQALSGRDWHPGTAFHPKEPILATLGDNDKAIRIWDIDDSLIAAFPAGRPDRTISAKVVLLGKTDAGKSSLAMRLTRNRYITDDESGSTLGMQFWQVDAETFHPESRTPAGEQRHITLWDFGGQDCYKLVHQLFLADATMAMVVIDPTRTEEAASQAREWSVVLERHQMAGGTKLLVGAKQDKKSPLVNRVFMEELCRKFKYAGFIEVSAKTGFGIPALCEKISSLIPWARLASTTRPELFQAIREEIVRSQARGDVIRQLIDLKNAVRSSCAASYEEDAVDIVVRQMCQQGVIALTSDTHGVDVLVLQVPVIERYAAALVQAANLNPKGVPAIEERQLAMPQDLLSYIDPPQRVLPDQEKTIIECVTDLMIKASICFRHQGLLVFPTLFRPTEVDDDAPIRYPAPVYYDFTGAIDNIYASAVVQLILGGEFGTARLWLNRVEFDQPGQGVCGVRRIERPSGLAHLDLYFAAKTPPGRKALFERFIEAHLLDHGVDVQEYKDINCGYCGETILAAVVQTNINNGEKDVICPYCRKHTLISEGVKISARFDLAVAQDLVALRAKIDDQTQRDAQDVKAVVSKVAQKMGEKRPVRILHLSDLHFSANDGCDPSARLRWLVEDLRHDEGVEFPKVDELEYLVISGDFTDKGSEEGFVKAYDFLAMLRVEMGLSADRVILVPGNHDATDLRESYRYEYVLDNMHAINPETYVQKGDIYLVREDDMYPKRFAMFDEKLYHKFKVKPYPLAFQSQGVPHTFVETGIQFLTFNSAWKVDQFNRKRSSIHPGSVASCIEEADKQAQAAGVSSPMLRFMVVHHAIAGRESMADPTVVTNLRKAGVKFCFHGDVHEPRAELIGYTDPEKAMHVIGAGSFGAPFGELPTSTPRLYNLIEIDPRGRTLRVYVRRQDSENAAWEGMFEWRARGGGQGKVPFFDLGMD